MKKKYLIPFLSAAALSCVIAFSSCETTTEDNNVTVELVDSATGESLGTKKIRKGFGFYRTGTFFKGLGGIDDPVREGYFFNGWYKDSACTMRIAEETGVEYIPTDGEKFYAGWSDHTEVPTNTGHDPHPLVNEIFNFDLSLEWVGSPSNYVRFTGRISPKKDITGELTDDVIEFQLDARWYSAESFMGEAVNPGEIVESVSVREVYLERSKGYTLEVNKVEQADFYNTSLINVTQKIVPRIMYSCEGEPGSSKYVTVQYKH